MTEREIIKDIAWWGRISHREIGEKIGISQSAVSAMLSGDTPMRADRLSDMCKAVGAELIIRRGDKEWKI